MYKSQKMKSIFHMLLGAFLLLPAMATAQQFTLHVEPITVENFPGLQSYAFAQYEGKWILLGGRTDGLHKRQANSSFDEAGQNKQITVVDIQQQKVWTASVASLSPSIQEQLLSSNMEFYQADSFLYLVGGYGYSRTKATHITHPVLSAVHLPSLVSHVVNGQSITQDFRQISDTNFAVTGGYLNVLNGVYHLTGGHRFDGRYNPMGHASYTQTYTNADRKFILEDDGNAITVNFLPEDYDPNAFHRRDYNVVPQVFPSGDEGLIAFSGVFQPQADLPYLDAVIIDSSSYKLSSNFSQYYQQYHCAHIPLYSDDNKAMHTLFLGGIAQYYDSAGTLVRDDDVPFTKGVSRVTLDQSGQLKEYTLGIQLPGYLGASSEFIPDVNLPEYANGVIKYDALQGDTVPLGYMVGGIQSMAKNIFFINTGIESNANATLYRVSLVKGISSGFERLNNQSIDGLSLQVYPNPSAGKCKLFFIPEEGEHSIVRIRDLQGKEIYKGQFLGHLGKQEIDLDCSFIRGEQVVILEVESGDKLGRMKLILRP